MNLSIKTDLKELYANSLSNKEDAGCDLFFPEEVIVPGNSTMKINLKIQVELRDSLDNPRSFMLFPRSSISKTPLRMSNSIGLIDSGYRGDLMVYVDNIYNEPFVVVKNSRLFQIVAPDLSPISISVVDTLSNSDRGTDGFGSTGI
jgi:dUTP pyrophosphatase